MSDTVNLYNKNNPYGYQLNVNHPDVRPHYERYKVKVGQTILSDAQRYEFERYMIPYLKKHGK